MSEEERQRPRQEASDPEREPAPGDEVEPGTEGAAETVCDVCGGSGRLDNGEQCSNCNGTGVIIKAVGGGG
jgi:RecJ-like exonuclease